MQKRVFVVSDLHLNFIVNSHDFNAAVYDAQLNCSTQKQRDMLFKEIFIEYTTRMLPQEDTTKDILVIAGDLWEGHKAFSWKGLSWMEAVASRFQHVVLVAGNHDYWHSNISAWEDKARKYLDKSGITNVHVLDNGVWADSGSKTLFVGGTLWTDMSKQNPITMLNAPSTMAPDFRYIRCGGNYRKFTPEKWATEHKKTKRWINHIVHLQKGYKIVVVTHHLPSHCLCDPRYRGEESNHYYASSCEQMMYDNENITHWIAGHTHAANELTIHKTTCIVNPCGYFFSEDHREETGFVRGKYFVIG